MINLSPGPWRQKGKHPGDIADSRGCPVMSVWLGGLAARHFKANSSAALRLPAILEALGRLVADNACYCGVLGPSPSGHCGYCVAKALLAEIEKGSK